MNSRKKCDHEPNIFTKQLSIVHQATKCIKCGVTLIRVSNSKWMTNDEYYEYNNSGVTK